MYTDFNPQHIKVVSMWENGFYFVTNGSFNFWITETPMLNFPFYNSMLVFNLC